MIYDYFGKTPFRTNDLSAIFPDCANIPAKAARLVATGEMVRLKKGLYVAAPQRVGGELSRSLIANHLCWPSYVSMMTALSLYGLIPEAVYETMSVSYSRTMTVTNAAGRFSFVKAPPEYFAIGITSRQNDGEAYLIATPEKALCDQIVFTPNLYLRSHSDTLRYLFGNLRFDPRAIAKLDTQILDCCAATARKRQSIENLIKLVEAAKPQPLNTATSPTTT